MKKAVLNFLRYGVQWDGEIVLNRKDGAVSQDARAAMSLRHVRLVLEQIVSQLPEPKTTSGEAAEIEMQIGFSGVTLGKERLSGGYYSGSHVSDALRILKAAGLVYRRRNRISDQRMLVLQAKVKKLGGKACIREDIATTLVNPRLLEIGLKWYLADKKNVQRGIYGRHAHPSFGRIQLPLETPWPRK